jgi:Domain of unknown function (DUF4173)
MKNQLIPSVLILIGTLLFNYIFWMEEMGINTIIFTAFIIGALLYVFEDSRKDKKVQILMAGTFLLSLLVVLNASVVSRIIYILSFSTMIGLAQQREIRFLVYSGLLYVSNLLETPKHFLKELGNIPFLKGKTELKRQLGVAGISIFVVPIFYFIYYAANKKFAELADRFWGEVFKIFSFDWDFGHVFFFILGFIVVGAAIWKHKLIDFRKFDNQQNIFLNEREHSVESSEHEKAIGNTYKSGVLLVILLNVLLFLNNILDIQYVWIGDAIMRTPQELKSYVHEGTFILIFGILLALAVVFWLFKGDLNFIKNNRILRGWTYAWLIQNGVLALSVGMRNWQYIDYYGLAYKRVGVFVFLTLVLSGLVILYFKITEKRSFFYFITRGAWALYAVMLLTCIVNWDIFITNYNLLANVKSGFIDVDFLVRDVSNKNTYILFQNVDKIIAHLPASDSTLVDVERDVRYAIKDKTAFLKALEHKKESFWNSQKGLTWLSWNYPDYVNVEYFKAK